MFWVMVYDDMSLQWKIHCRRATLKLAMKEAAKLKGKQWEISLTVTMNSK